MHWRSMRVNRLTIALMQIVTGKQEKSTMKALKLSTTEQKLIYENALRLNQKLIAKGIAAMQESEILHCLIALGLQKLNVDRNGNLGFYAEIQDELPLR